MCVCAHACMYDAGAGVCVCDAGAGVCVCVCVCACGAGAGVCVLRGGAVSVSFSYSLLPNEHPGPSSLQWTQRRGSCLSQALLSQTEPSMWKGAIQPASSLYP